MSLNYWVIHHTESKQYLDAFRVGQRHDRTDHIDCSWTGKVERALLFNSEDRASLFCRGIGSRFIVVERVEVAV